MKCIGNKCSLCHQHEFQSSYYYCELDDVGFRKDSLNNHKCNLEFEFSIIKDKYERLIKIVDENQQQR